MHFSLQIVLYFDVRCRAIFPAEWYLSNFKNSEKTLTLCEVIPQTKECEKGKLAIKLVDTNLTAWNQRTIKLMHHQVHMYIYTASEIEQKDHLVYGKQRSMLRALDEAPAVINLATYNANGLKNAIERGFLNQLPDNLDVLCIQETKSNSKLPTLSAETHLKHARRPRPLRPRPAPVLCCAACMGPLIGLPLRGASGAQFYSCFLHALCVLFICPGARSARRAHHTQLARAQCRDCSPAQR